jgi:hypothetical protein
MVWVWVRVKLLATYPVVEVADVGLKIAEQA